MTSLNLPQVTQDNGVLHSLLTRFPDALFVVSASALRAAGNPLPTAQTYFVHSAAWEQVSHLQSVIAELSPHTIIALGGGKVLDVAKLAARLRPLTEEQIGDLSRRKLHADMLTTERRLIAIPTTTGTGSEVSQVTVITFAREKVPLAHPSLVPDAVMLDPQLTKTAPRRVKAAAAWDAMVHAIESYVSPISSAGVRQFATPAFRTACDYLQILADDMEPDDDAETRMQWAGLWAGVAQSKASVGLTHAISHSLESVCDLLHGELNAHFASSVIQYNMEKKYDLYERFSKEVGFDNPQVLLSRLSDLRARSPIAPLPTIEATPDLCARISKDPCIRTNPRFISKDQLPHILAGGW